MVSDIDKLTKRSLAHTHKFNIWEDLSQDNARVFAQMWREARIIYEERKIKLTRKAKKGYVKHRGDSGKVVD